MNILLTILLVLIPVAIVVSVIVFLVLRKKPTISYTPPTSSAKWNPYPAPDTSKDIYYRKRDWSPANEPQPTEGPIDGSWLSYYGCYSDADAKINTANRMFPNYATGTVAHLGACYDFAKNNGDPYFGIQFWQGTGGQCFSGKNDPTNPISQGCTGVQNVLATLDSSGPQPIQVGKDYINAVYKLNDLNYQPPPPPPKPSAVWNPYPSPDLPSNTYYVKRDWSPSTEPQPEGPIDGSWLSYYGCYTDPGAVDSKSSRMFPNSYNNSKPTDLYNCYGFAKDNKYPYFGIQYWQDGLGGECWGGTGVPPNDAYRKILGCTGIQNVKATLDSSGPQPLQVGGQYMNAVYQLNDLNSS